MKIDVVDSGANKVSETTLDPSIFSAPVNAGQLHDVVVNQLATRRRGTHKTKGRSEVRGGGRKPWKQKGTGRARAGSVRSPIFRGGGIIFGPQPRTYGSRIPKKVRRGALLAALTVKANEAAIIIVDKIELSEAKTREAIKILSALGCVGQKTLIVTSGRDEKVGMSFRNVPSVGLLDVAGVNPYDLLNNNKVVITLDALTALNERFDINSTVAEAVGTVETTDTDETETV